MTRASTLSTLALTAPIACAAIIPSIALSQTNPVSLNEISNLILTQSLSEHLEFQRTTLQRIQAEACRLGSSFCQYDDFRDQIPDRFHSLVETSEVAALFVEGSCMYLAEMGVPDGSLDEADVNFIRLSHAFQRAGIRVEMSRSLAGQLHVNYNLSDPHRSMRNFNESLLVAYEAGNLPLPYIVLDHSQCGAGEELVTFEISQDLRFVYIIPEFFFGICEARYDTPWDPATCRWWETIGYNAWISGAYIWQGAFPDGQRVWGRIDVRRFADQVVRLPN